MFQEPLWKTQDISEEVFLAGLCLAKKFYFLVLAEIRFTAAAWGFCADTHASFLWKRESAR